MRCFTIILADREGVMSARWRKQPHERGLSGFGQGPRGFELRENGKLVIMVEPLVKDRFTVVGWYWYGMGQNTCMTPCKTMEDAKQQATEYYKSNRKAKP